MKAVGNALRVFHSKGRYNRSSVGTFVERTSRYVILVQLDNAKAETVRDGFVRELKGVPQNLLKSITYDQSREMAAHQDLAATLNLAVYFSALSQPPPHPPPQGGRARAELSRESVSHFMRLSARTA